jgi:hypothetical protein
MQNRELGPCLASMQRTLIPVLLPFALRFPPSSHIQTALVLFQVKEGMAPTSKDQLTLDPSGKHDPETLEAFLSGDLAALHSKNTEVVRIVSIAGLTARMFDNPYISEQVPYMILASCAGPRRWSGISCNIKLLLFFKLFFRKKAHDTWMLEWHVMALGCLIRMSRHLHA